MRWLLAGLAFAALVALAVGTATIRAENSIRRHQVELRYAEVRDHLVERRRLEAVLLDCASSRRLADLHALYFELEAARRAGGVQ